MGVYTPSSQQMFTSIGWLWC